MWWIYKYAAIKLSKRGVEREERRKRSSKDEQIISGMRLPSYHSSRDGNQHQQGSNSTMKGLRNEFIISSLCLPVFQTLFIFLFFLWFLFFSSLSTSLLFGALLNRFSSRFISFAEMKNKPKTKRDFPNQHQCNSVPWFS